MEMDRYETAPPGGFLHVCGDGPTSRDETPGRPGAPPRAWRWTQIYTPGFRLWLPRVSGIDPGGADDLQLVSGVPRVSGIDRSSPRAVNRFLHVCGDGPAAPTVVQRSRFPHVCVDRPSS
jgi:hypothetical protein